jgi:DNA-binding CsgD family transcriptional regulator
MVTPFERKDRSATSLPLFGRDMEAARLDALLGELREGSSASLVIEGDAGVGKTALLEYLIGRASGCRVAHVAGIQSEAELPFAGVHQLCEPMLVVIDRIPEPQRYALEIALGRRSGGVPDRFLVSLAVLSLLSEFAADAPLVCVVDDFQWLDDASKHVIAFVARRLRAESLGVVIGTRVRVDLLDHLPKTHLGGLSRSAAMKLGDALLGDSFDRSVKAQIVAEAQGNPLALIELARANDSADLAGGFRIPRGVDLREGIEAGFRARIDRFSPPAQLLLVVAAADPTGDPALVLAAARSLGVDVGVAGEIAADGFADFEPRVRFQHPLARASAYWAAKPGDRKDAHRALAEHTSDETDPDRRSWHLAEAAVVVDDSVAEQLVMSADRALRRGGYAAAGAFLARAADLTTDSTVRGRRALAAAAAEVQAGAFDAALELVGRAEAAELTAAEMAQCDVIRGGIEFAASRGGEAPVLLLRGAERLQAIEPGLARESYLEAIVASAFAGRLAGEGGGVRDIAAAASKVGMPEVPRSADYLLDGLTRNFGQGYAAGVPSLQRALDTFDDDADPDLRWMWSINLAALHLWDDERWSNLSARYVDLARSIGAMSELPLAYSTRAMVLIHTGALDAAVSLVEEQAAVSEATGSSLAPYSAMSLAAMRGDAEHANALIERTLEEAPRRGEGTGASVAEWAHALLRNGQADYPAAMAAAERALHGQEYPEMRYPGIGNWAVAELVEAAVRSGQSGIAESAHEWIVEMSDASGTPWARGVEARARALISAGETADEAYAEAIELLDQSRAAPDRARARLLYGEWLRRERRRTEAKTYLSAAVEMFDSIGMAAFATRARQELRAAGGREVGRARGSARSGLTAQEKLIAEMAAQGMTNPEIAGRLFISPRTVQYHLGKVFSTLGVESRSQLKTVLREAG